jgi:hypothetical protein
MLRHGVALEDLAEACEVEPKTVERWINTGRVPHANPTFHFRRLDGGSLAEHYMASFERVWGEAMPWSGTEI